jgi:hypothetical protein
MSDIEQGKTTPSLRVFRFLRGPPESGNTFSRGLLLGIIVFIMVVSVWKLATVSPQVTGMVVSDLCNCSCIP